MTICIEPDEAKLGWGGGGTFWATVAGSNSGAVFDDLLPLPTPGNHIGPAPRVRPGSRKKGLEI